MTLIAPFTETLPMEDTQPAGRPRGPERPAAIHPVRKPVGRFRRLPAAVQHSRVCLWLLVLVQAATVPAGCDLYGQDEYEEQFVVESYLIARQPLPEVRLSTTAPFNEPYYFDERAVPDAVVVIHRYNEENVRDRTYEYIEAERGVYRIGQQNILNRVLPRHTYKLEIILPHENDHRITAVTHVPDTFSVREVIRDEAWYQGEDQLEFRITRNRANNRQNYFIYATESLEPDADNLTPFWREATDDTGDIEELIRIRTNIVNEENFDRNPDGTLTLRMPWIGIAFFGRNIISTYSLDDSAYDFFRSQPVQSGGGPGSLSPGEIQNVIYNIDGAIGLFGSMSVLDIEVNVLSPPGL